MTSTTEPTTLRTTLQPTGCYQAQPAKVPTEQNPHDLRRVQRRTLVVLTSSQVFAGIGLGAGATVAGLLAQHEWGSTALAGLPSGLYTAGSAAAAILVGTLSQARGRRPGLAAGYLAGAVGAVGVVIGAASHLLVVLLVSLVVYGAGTATNLQARYAGADLANPMRRGRDVSTVLVATTVGGVLGPNLVGVSSRWADRLHLPALSGPFLLASMAYLAAAVVLAIWLRPDPLLLSRQAPLTGTSPTGTSSPGTQTTDAQTTGTSLTGTPISARRRSLRRTLVAGAGIIMVAQLVMNAVMTMTPVEMSAHGHDTDDAGFVIALHIAAMFLPSLVSGRLVDRYSARTVATISAAVLLGAGLVAAAGPAASMSTPTAALVLLGIGWNLALVSGTTLITGALPSSRRARVQGRVDLAIAAAGAAGGLASGLVVAATSYTTLALASGLTALLLIPLALGAHRCRSAD